jgi:hypothetical protein
MSCAHAECIQEVAVSPSGNRRKLKAGGKPGLEAAPSCSTLRAADQACFCSTIWPTSAPSMRLPSTTWTPPSSQVRQCTGWLSPQAVRPTIGMQKVASAMPVFPPFIGGVLHNLFLLRLHLNCHIPLYVSWCVISCLPVPLCSLDVSHHEARHGGRRLCSLPPSMVCCREHVPAAVLPSELHERVYGAGAGDV